MSTEPKDNTPKAADEAEPTSGSSPAPIALLILSALLVYWGMLYLDKRGGGFNPQVYQPYADFKDVDAHQLILDPAVILKRDGEKIFSAKCAICHQANGSGGANGCPPLAGSDWVGAGGPNRIARLVMNGGSGPITVHGKDYVPSVSMLSFKDDLSDKEIASVLSYVRSSWGNNASIVLPDQVKKIRDAASSRRTPWTSAELQQIPDSDPVKK